MLEGADLVLAIGPRQVAALRRRSGYPSGEAHAPTAYAAGAPGEEEISDRYGGP
jgi:hypothetical protein